MFLGTNANQIQFVGLDANGRQVFAPTAVNKVANVDGDDNDVFLNTNINQQEFIVEDPLTGQTELFPVSNRHPQGIVEAIAAKKVCFVSDHWEFLFFI